MSSQSDTSVAWVAADWGTSHLRLWPMGADGVPLCRIDSDQGMSRLTAAEYEPVLLSLLSSYMDAEAPLDVLCCGMAGSRQGWAEAPYAATPCVPPSVDSATQVATTDSRLRVFILSGVKQADPADVMRGEETQIAGVLARNPSLDGVICLPGTHTKWVSVQAGTITRFATFLSGELFQLLSQHSVLRHTVATSGWDQAAFDEGCRQGEAAPARLAGTLFGLRAEALLTGLEPVAARSRLSGLLLGMEISALRDEWQGRSVVIVGENNIADAYAAALARNGTTAEIADAEQITLAGLCAARAQMT